MNRIAALLMMMSFLATEALACNFDMVTINEWRIEVVDPDTNRLIVSFTFHGDRPVRMIDASAQFQDVLGGRIASFALDRDVSLANGATFTQDGLWGPFTFERLLDMRREDVVARVCTKAVVHDDGEVKRFGS